MSGRAGSAAAASAAILVAVLCTAGCDYSEARRANPESQLIDLKSRRTVAVDDLYTEYGGGALLRSLDSPSGAEPSQDSETYEAFLDFARGIAEEGDRSLFEEQVRVVGRGDRPVTLSTRVREFFSRPDVRASCRRIVELDYQVERLERELEDLEGRRSSKSPQ